MTSNNWLDDSGLVTLPAGPRVRGRRLSDTVSPADFALRLADGPVPVWPQRRIRWPDFWIPLNRADALDALHEAHRRAHAGERVEVTCRSGIGRTGTALAALAGFWRPRLRGILVATESDQPICISRRSCRAAMSSVIGKFSAPFVGIQTVAESWRKNDNVAINKE